MHISVCMCDSTHVSVRLSRAEGCISTDDRDDHSGQGPVCQEQVDLGDPGYGPIQPTDPKTPPGVECVLTHAAHPAGVQLKILGAVAEVAAGGVDTQAVDAVHGVCTLIHICGVGAPSAGSPPLTHFPSAFFPGSRALAVGGQAQGPGHILPREESLMGQQPLGSALSQATPRPPLLCSTWPGGLPLTALPAPDSTS